jgi:hypothetical protein
MGVSSFRKTIVFRGVGWSGVMGNAMKSKKINKGHIFSTIV